MLKANESQEHSVNFALFRSNALLHPLIAQVDSLDLCTGIFRFSDVARATVEDFERVHMNTATTSYLGGRDSFHNFQAESHQYHINRIFAATISTDRSRHSQRSRRPPLLALSARQSGVTLTAVNQDSRKRLAKLTGCQQANVDFGQLNVRVVAERLHRPLVHG